MSEPPVLDGAVQFSGTDIADPVVAEGPFRHRADGTGLDPAPQRARRTRENQAGRSAPPNARLSALMMLSLDRIAFVKPFCELFINFFSNPFGPYSPGSGVSWRWPSR